MLFFKVEARYLKEEKAIDKRNKEYNEIVADHKKRSRAFAKSEKWECYINFRDMTRKGKTYTLATNSAENQVLEIFKRYFDFFGEEMPVITQIAEIGFSEWRNLSNIEMSGRDMFTYPQFGDLNEVEIVERMGMKPVHIPYIEEIVDGVKDFNREKALFEAKNLLCGNTFNPELGRIFSSNSKSCGRGHPVHYFIKGDDKFVKREIEEILIRSLYVNGRVDSRRYAVINIEDRKQNDNNNINDFGFGLIDDCNGYDALYKLCAGATIVVRYINDGVSEGNYAKISTGKIRDICDAAVKHKNETLTIITLQRNDNRVYEQFCERLDGMTFVTIEEEAAVGQTARDYLITCAKNAHIEPNEELLSMVKGEAVSYNAAELKKIFDSWLSKVLRTQIYPQYAEIINTKAIKDKPKGSAWQELDDLIGLNEAKAVIKRAINFHKARKLFKNMGKQNSTTAMHLVFSGNPGTAKTTVARLFAQILKDNGILSVGELIECGRADLIGQYVGWTAPQVREKFRQAKGSVLFIDEAYSLCDPSDHRGSFGDEAINTIVQEMENHREDMVVIFAGYPKEMELFLEQNPGLRSRIAFKVGFNDYNAEELYQILELMVKKQEKILGGGVEEKLLPILKTASKKVNFGNGRFVRNLFEQAKMSQADRLVEMNPEDVSLEDLSLLLPEDFCEPKVSLYNERRIGFDAQKPNIIEA